MRREDLIISNLNNTEQVEEIKKIVCSITGARFAGADLASGLVEFDLYQDFDNLDLTDVQCRLREYGFEAGQVNEGTCTLRFTAP